MKTVRFGGSMQTVLFGLLVLVSGGCLSTPRVGRELSPATSIEHSGVKVVSPDDRGWLLVRASGSGVVFEKHERGSLMVLGTSFSSLEEAGDGEQLLENLEKEKRRELARYRTLSVHFNFTEYKGVACLQYDGVFQTDRSDENADPSYFQLKGYVVPYPEGDETTLQLEWSYRSFEREMSEQLVAIGNRFFERVELTEN